MDNAIAFGEILFDCFGCNRKLGGAPFNFVWHLNAHKLHAKLVSAVGDDADGVALLNEVRANGVDTSLISRSQLHPTGLVKVTMDEAGKHTFTIGTPAAWDDIQPTQDFQAAARNAQVAYWGTLAMRMPQNRQLCFQTIQNMGDNALRIFDINLRQEYYSAELIRESLQLCNVLKVSDEELPVLQRLLALPQAPNDAIVSIAKDFAIPTVIYTCGAQGAIGYQGGKMISVPAYPIPRKVDTVGCGDAFTAGWCAATMKGVAFQPALQHAARIAGLIAAAPGAIPKEDYQEYWSAVANIG